MTVLTLGGKQVNWHAPPKPTTMVMWHKRTTGGKIVKGSLRSIAALDRLNTLAIKKFGKGVEVIQSAYNTGVRASAGTHDYDACFDVFIPGVAWAEQQAFFRANGAGAYWRKPPAFGNHIHLFILPPREGKVVDDDYRIFGFKVGKYVDGGWSLFGRKITSSQIGDYYSKRNALSGHAHDPSWFPSPQPIFDLNDYIATQRGPVVVTPPVPGQTPAAKGTLKFRVATNNIMSLPKNPAVSATLAANGGAELMGVQEADLTAYKAALRHVPGLVTASIPAGNTYNAFVYYDPKVFAHVSTRFIKQYDGVAGISYTRRIASTVLRHRATGTLAAGVSYHSVTAGNDKARKAMRKEGDAVVNAEVARLRKSGIPLVFLMTDANRKTRVSWTSTLWYTHGIDHIYAWAKRTLFSLRSSGRWNIATRSDHDTFVVEYIATPKK